MLLTFLFIFLLFSLIGKLISFAIKASWGILKVLFFIVFGPAILVFLFASGLAAIAVVLAGIMLIISFFRAAIL